MLKILLRSATTLLLFTSLSAKALPIVEADAFTAGDNKAALETATGLTWLDYGVNSGKSYNTVVSELDTVYAGWRLPTQAEVVNLWTSLFGSEQIYSSKILQSFSCKELNCYPEQSSLLSIFGKNDVGPFAYVSFVFSNDQNTVYHATYTHFYDVTYLGFASLIMEWDGFDKDRAFGRSTMLVKDATKTEVPEPSTLFLFALGFLGLGIKRFRKAA